MQAVDGGKTYVDFFPWLRYIPKVSYKAQAAAYYQFAEKTYRSLMDSVKESLVRICVAFEILVLNIYE